ncbi:putative holin-like toxin [Leuconostoc suionicum]|uniref:putative holin-like toxin n=1 Tax=Leuconostoc suionicum TaxID=1511761 RepID=UPI0028D3DE0A|nr:putative holin-like toxin [Leuconostoc suionicum]
MFAFGGFIISILTFVVLLIEKISKKNNRLIFSPDNDYLIIINSYRLKRDC